MLLRKEGELQFFEKEGIIHIDFEDRKDVRTLIRSKEEKEQIVLTDKVRKWDGNVRVFFADSDKKVIPSGNDGMQEGLKRLNDTVYCLNECLRDNRPSRMRSIDQIDHFVLRKGLDWYLS